MKKLHTLIKSISKWGSFSPSSFTLGLIVQSVFGVLF